MSQDSLFVLHIQSIMVLQGHGTDILIINASNLPVGTWPFDSNASLKMEVAHGKGPEYVREHFKIEPNIIQMSGF